MYELTDWPVWESEPAEFDRYYDKTEVALLPMAVWMLPLMGRTSSLGPATLVTFPMECTVPENFADCAQAFQTVDE